MIHEHLLDKHCYTTTDRYMWSNELPNAFINIDWNGNNKENFLIRGLP